MEDHFRRIARLFEKMRVPCIWDGSHSEESTTRAAQRREAILKLPDAGIEVNGFNENGLAAAFRFRMGSRFALPEGLPFDDVLQMTHAIQGSKQPNAALALP